jgi:hypothetical protein
MPSPAVMNRWDFNDPESLSHLDPISISISSSDSIDPSYSNAQPRSFKPFPSESFQSGVIFISLLLFCKLLAAFPLFECKPCSFSALPSPASGSLYSGLLDAPLGVGVVVTEEQLIK